MNVRFVAAKRTRDVAVPTRGRLTRIRLRLNVDRNGESLGERLRRLRAERGLSGRQLADMAGVQLQTIWKLEQERGSCSCESLAALAEAFGVEMGELWRGALGMPEPVDSADGGGG